MNSEPGNMEMLEDLESPLRQAIDRSRRWAIDGWPVAFGERGVVVASLDQAQGLPVTAVHRLVALGYWHNVAQLGFEAAAWGEKALGHLAAGDIAAAEAAVYYAWYLERPLAHRTRTWQAVHEQLRLAAYPVPSPP